MSPQYADAFPDWTFRLEDISQHHRSRRTGKEYNYIKRMTTTLSGYHLSAENCVMAVDFLTDLF